MKHKYYRQYDLEEYGDTAQLVVWLEDDPRLTVDAVLTLKEAPGRQWIVKALWSPCETARYFEETCNLYHYERRRELASIIED